MRGLDGVGGSMELGGWYEGAWGRGYGMGVKGGR